MYIIFDTETTGLPRNWNAPITDTDNWPRCIQIAWQLHDENGKLIEHKDYLVKPNGFDIPYDAEKIHGISTLLAEEKGEDLDFVLQEFNEALKKAKFVVGQNVGFDVNIMGCEFYRQGVESPMASMPVLDTCTEVTANLCRIPGGRGGKFKLPTLTELHEYLFNQPFAEAHNATADVEATTRCFLELIRLNIFTADELQVGQEYFQNFQVVNPTQIPTIGLNHLNLKKESEKLKKELGLDVGGEITTEQKNANRELLKNVEYSHLHNHTQYSILQSTTQIGELIKTAAKQGSPGVAITDHGNMMAAFLFEKAVAGYNKGVKKERKEAEEKGESFTKKEIKPIIGYEAFVCKKHDDKKNKDNGFQIPLIAKNKAGYDNLIKLASSAFTHGFYYVPRIDKEQIVKYKADVIATTGNMYGEVPYLILNVGEKQAEEAFVWWKEQFGEDFYVELMRHGQEDEDRVNEVLLRFAKKYEVKYFASNNTYYINQEDANAHDILLCVKEGERQSTPIGRGRGFRYGFPNQEYYFKTPEQMKELFIDLPEAIINTNEIVDKIEPFPLARDILLPAFDIPEEFQDPKDDEEFAATGKKGQRGENNYLRHLTYVGAKEKYKDLSEDLVERIDFELEVIANTGYPGYFLIVQDFCKAALKMGVSVGPGRGSAAGSVVAYCNEITNVDPVRYDLLFERFLNPERVSMPDVDIDFDDEGRGRIIEWVINKYGANQVAQIITYGTMAAKSSIRDTARALDLPLSEADRVAKLVPDMKLNKLFNFSEDKLKEKLNPEQMEMAHQLKELSKGEDLTADTINQAIKLEGSVRNTGIHACGVIITPDDITNFVPVALAKDSDMYCTQFDNSVAEEAGLLKMDFLGLKTLTLIKDACKIVKERRGVILDPNNFPLDDEETYALFQRGETVGIFQYESAGMQKYLRELKPTVFPDLIAMNALYRPGPLEYIPSFIKRKHGDEEIIYDLDANEEYLAETYGITVYQEQVMLLSQKLAGFTKGEADTLRKAMGKKKFDLLAMLKPKFLDQGEGNGHNRNTLEKIWKDWEAFAAYAFNKSHSTCYAWVAYQTAYLKAHFPAEYMASVLSNNMNDIKSVTFFMEECQRMGISVLGPDVNESQYKFAVNAKGEIRFGLGAMKGVGEGAVRSIIESRDEGKYTSVFDFAKKVDLKATNKRVFESLAQGGGFDSFTGTHRAQYFGLDHKGRTLIENAIRFGASFNEIKNSSQVSLFGDSSEVEIPEPPILPAEEWTNLQQLAKEKDVVGIYISGHPLDDFKLEFDNFCNATTEDLNFLDKLKGRDITLGGQITEALHRTSKNGNPFGIFTLEDYVGSHKFMVFNEDYLRLRTYMMDNIFVYVQGRVRAKWGNEKNLEFSINKMEYLANVRDRLAKKINLLVEQKNINQSLVNHLIQLVNKYPGNKTLGIKVYDQENKISLPMFSKSKGVELSNEFLKELGEIENINFDIN